MFAEYILAAIGVLLIVFSFWVNPANNFLSKLLFAIFPFFAGVYVVGYAVNAMGIITVGGV